MEDAGVGWIAAIIVGGIAGWLAEQFMKSNVGLILNIVLGIVGAAIASAILSAIGINLGGWVGYLISGFIGAALLIWIVRAASLKPSITYQLLVDDGVFSLFVACRVVGRLVGGAKQFLEIHAKKAGRDRHHHGRALH